MGLAVSVELVDDLGAADGDEVRLGLVGDGPGQHRLAASGGAVEQHAARRFDAEPLEDLGVAHGHLDHLADPGHCLAQTADVLIRHLGRVGAAGGPAARGLDLDAGRLGDHHEADGIGGGDVVVLSAGAEHTDAHALADPDNQTDDERPDVTAVAGVRRERRADRRQRDGLGVRHLGEFHRDPVLEAGADVLAGDAVHLDLPLAAFSADQGHDLKDGGTLAAGDGHHVADRHPEVLHIRAVQPGEPTPDILRRGPRDAQEGLLVAGDTGNGDGHLLGGHHISRSLFRYSLDLTTMMFNMREAAPAGRTPPHIPLTVIYRLPTDTILASAERDNTVFVSRGSPPARASRTLARGPVPHACGRQSEVV